MCVSAVYFLGLGGAEGSGCGVDRRSGDLPVLIPKEMSMKKRYQLACCFSISSSFEANPLRGKHQVKGALLKQALLQCVSFENNSNSNSNGNGNGNGNTLYRMVCEKGKGRERHLVNSEEMLHYGVCSSRPSRVSLTDTDCSLPQLEWEKMGYMTL
ncbi:hypothetical protein SDJN03_16360, partial [Cucurbita argyrosperma subsp. sororia]